jgi:peptide/nickel transport system substrate-binding protein
VISRRQSLLWGAASIVACASRGSRAHAGDLATVRFGSAAADDHTYDPRITMTGTEEQIIVHVFDRLIAVADDNSLQPFLAKSWEVAADFRSVTLQLRDDVIFHDGTPFNAAAVKFTFDTIIDPSTGSMGAIDVIGPYVGSDILAPHTIQMRYRTPFPRLLFALADNKASIVSPSAARSLGIAGFGQAPVGTGPFRFVSWKKGVEVILERNPRYGWGPAFLPAGPPRVGRLLHRFVPHTPTRISALDAGELDICEQAPPLDIRRMTTTSRYRSLIGNSLGVPFGFSLNSSRGPFSDLRVRRAFMHCVNRAWISENLFFGIVKPAWGPLAASAPEYWPGVRNYYPFDPAAARRLLDEAGWHVGANGLRAKGAIRLALFLPILLEPRIGVVLQANAREVGFDLKIEQVTHERQEELIFRNAYDLLSLHWSLNDASVLEVPFLSANVPAPGRFSFNWSRYQDPALDQLLHGAAASAGALRNARYAEIQKRIMDQALFLPIHEATYNVVFTRRMAGLRLAHGNLQTLLSAVTISI